jgi:uncharacterized membrane protein
VKNTKTIVILALLTAIEIIFAFTVLGSIPIGPGIVATLAHIPPIIAATLLGKKEGLFMGCTFGVLSLIYWSTMGVASPVAFAFTPLAANGSLLSLIICLVPRIIYPVLTAYIFDLLMKATKEKTALSASVSAGVGTVVHSFLVFLFLFVFYRGHETVGHSFLNVVIAWGGVNAVMEIIVAVIVNSAIIPALKKVKF